MKNFHSNLRVLLSSRLLFQYYCLYIALIFIALIEMFSISLIPIFVNILINPRDNINIFNLSFLDYLDNLIILNDPIRFGTLILAAYVLKAFISFLIIFFQVHIFKEIRFSLSSDLIKNYIEKPFSFYINNNSSNIFSQILTEVDHTTTFLTSVLIIFKEIFLLFAFFLILVYLQPIVSLLSFLFIALIYGFFLILSDKFLKKIGKDRLYFLNQTYKVIFQIFGLIKDIKVFKKEFFFYNKFINLKKNLESKISLTELIKSLPKIFFELTGVFFIVILTIIFLKFNDNSKDLIPYLTLVAVTVIRFIPSFTSIATSFSWINLYSISYNKIVNEIIAFKNKKEKKKDNYSIKYVSKNYPKKLDIKNIFYNYSEDINDKKSQQIIDNVSLEIKKGKTIGIIGKSGTGKSTLINLILGLLKPQKGNIEIFSYKNFKKNLYITYVPQDILLLDDSIKKNVAFGVEEKKINTMKVKQCLKNVDLWDRVSSDKLGIEMLIGEKGIRLSGGERQRIGIARALYFEPTVLIMDEATSSLDHVTEKNVMDSILKIKNDYTIIIISHRLSSLFLCDTIYLFEKGKIKDKGNLSYLIKKYPKF